MIDSTDLKLVLLVVLLVSCAATDLKTRRIPNVILGPALIASLFLGSLGSVAGLLDAVGGLVVGICMLLPLNILGRMGAGDVKLMGVVGSILGVWGAVVAGFATMMAGAILGVGYIVWVVVVPQLLAGLPVFLKPFGSAADPAGSVSVATARTAGIPYGVAIAVGAIATVLYLNVV